MSILKTLSGIALGSSLALGSTLSVAQSGGAFQSRAITLVVPYAAGGVTDVVARMVATSLARELGQPVVVESVTGAGGNVGAMKVASAAPDGHMLLITQTSTVTNPLLDKTFKLDPSSGYTHIAYVGGLPLWLLANPAKTQYQTLAQLLKKIRQKPGKLNFGSGGSGSASHLGVAYLEKLEKIQALHVPYRGMSAALNDLMGGSVDFAFTPVAGTESLVQSGKLKALAITGPTRLKAFPDVPTFAETGQPRMDVMGWIGVSGPRGIPAPVVAKLNTAVSKVITEPQLRTALLERTLLVQAMTPEQFSNYVHAETSRWQPLIESTGIKSD